MNKAMLEEEAIVSEEEAMVMAEVLRRLEKEEPVSVPIWYWDEGLVNEDGTQYGTIRTTIGAWSRAEAVKLMEDYLRQREGEEMGYEWADDIRGMSPHEAAGKRLHLELDEDIPYGYGGNIWSQELVGEHLGEAKWSLR